MNKLIISISQAAVTQAEHAIDACDRCSGHADVPFWLVLHSFRNYPMDEVEYLLPVLAHCPNCSADIDEMTNVKANLTYLAE